MKPNTHKNTVYSNEYLEARDDAMLALDYIIRTLRQNNVNDIAEALMDIINTYNNVDGHGNLVNKNMEEYQDILHMYLMLKYHSKITLDKYKEKAFEMLTLQHNENEKDTIR
ncbi:MAG: hypothetical protein O3A66_01470 [Proteobacteria bacterium]|jgi:hypothetical protein|nr:hypothetical protein [Pseudomonadota bacterium]